MLETLIPSRIRRTLLEHLLAHPAERFYLRGLAKQLGVSVSPLRRELKRLERSGMLKSLREANVLFYTLDPTSPTVFQLTRATQQAKAPSVASVPTPVGLEDQAHVSIPLGVLSAGSVPSGWRSPLSGPALIAAAGIGMILIMLIGMLSYLTLTHWRLVSSLSPTVSPRQPDVTVVVPQPQASGTMRGSRWQIVPGGFGGFSGSAEPESY